MYRDQMQEGEQYDQLRPCYGIHMLVKDIFKDEIHKDRWFNHYGFINYETHTPLNEQWEMYYIELEKFHRMFSQDQANQWNYLEQWVDYIYKQRDLSKPLEPHLCKNDIIKEVDDMLQVFTKDDQLKEQYRLHEEWLRVQATEAAIRARLEKSLSLENV
jgi:hypothetical protein